MGRIKIDFPESVLFSTDIAVRITDINYGRHVGNDAYLSIIHEARMRFLQSYNLGELDFVGTALIMSDSAVVYKSEAYYGMTLQVEITPADFTKYGFDLYYRIVDKATGQEILLAKTGMVCFDYNTRKVTALPANIPEMWNLS
ncbi:thioesterase family protein [Cytophagaceae bacterium ABcell3]|nr:thioesterase family protein [Cytophagaceae bacterium ABcell3]